MNKIAPPPVTVALTCEHGGNRIPSAFLPLFRSARFDLSTHRGYDDGALQVAQSLSRHLDAPLLSVQISRLLIDCNRSPGSATLFSRWTQSLTAGQKAAIQRRFHGPHWAKARASISSGIRRRGSVLHLSIHSFTPVLRGNVRTADIGLLFDPSRWAEAAFARALHRALSNSFPRLRIRLNSPYRGTGDGLTAALRLEFPDPCYAGIELEFNQAMLKRRSPVIMASMMKKIALIIQAAAARP